MARKVLLYPYVTEKTMNYMTGPPTQDFKDGNKIEFIECRIGGPGVRAPRITSYNVCYTKLLRYRMPRSLLIVVSAHDAAVVKGARNLPGVEVAFV